jgi:hypothetical protein
MLLLSYHSIIHLASSFIVVVIATPFLCSQLCTVHQEGREAGSDR